MIRDRAEELLCLHAKHAPREDSPRSNGQRPSFSRSHSDEEVIEKACSERNGKFELLWHGDLSDYDHDHSVADDAFVHKLWPYTQDEEQVRRIHAASGLHRPQKSGKRPDYLRRSIERARQNVSWFYGWPDGASLNVNGHGERKVSAVLKDEVPAERKIRFRTAKEVAAETPPETRWYAEGWVAAAAITEVDGKIKAA